VVTKYIFGIFGQETSNLHDPTAVLYDKYTVLHSRDNNGWWAWSTKNQPKIIFRNHSRPLDSVGLGIHKLKRVFRTNQNAISDFLQPLSGQILTPQTANWQDDATADIQAFGFWGWQQCAFFDVRVFHSNALCYRKSSLSSIYRCHELQKKRKYGDHIREVEFASFTLLVFSTTGGMGRKGLTFYCRLAELLYRCDATTYSGILAWFHCTLSFSLLRSATMCIWGSHSISFRQSDASLELGFVNGPRDY